MYGLTEHESRTLIAEIEADDGPGDEMVPISPLMAKLLVGQIRAGDTSAMKTADRVLAEQGVPRLQRRAVIHKLKAMGPVPAPDPFKDFMNFLKGLAA